MIRRSENAALSDTGRVCHYSTPLPDNSAALLRQFDYNILKFNKKIFSGNYIKVIDLSMQSNYTRRQIIHARNRRPPPDTTT